MENLYFEIFNKKMNKEKRLYLFVFNTETKHLYQASVSKMQNDFYILTTSVYRERCKGDRVAYSRFIYKLNKMFEASKIKVNIDDLLYEWFVEESGIYRQSANTVLVNKADELDFQIEDFNKNLSDIQNLINKYNNLTKEIFNPLVFNPLNTKLLKEVDYYMRFENKSLRSILQMFQEEKDIKYTISKYDRKIIFAPNVEIPYGEDILYYEKKIYDKFNFLYQYLRIEILREIEKGIKFEMEEEEILDIDRIFNFYSLCSMKTNVFDKFNNISEDFNNLKKMYIESVPKDIVTKSMPR